jgi:Na+/melibiose symporter-like transporter
MDAHGAETVRIPEHVANLLGAFYGPGAGLLYVGAILVTFLYELDSRRHAAILEELSVRRSKIGEAKAIPA